MNASNRAVVRVVLVLVCIGVTAGSVANVFLDNSEVKALAEQTGCGASAKTCAMTRMDRTPIEQSFELSTTGGVSVHVSCMRAGVLVGAYACKKE